MSKFLTFVAAFIAAFVISMVVSTQSVHAETWEGLTITNADDLRALRAHPEYYLMQLDERPNALWIWHNVFNEEHNGAWIIGAGCASHSCMVGVTAAIASRHFGLWIGAHIINKYAENKAEAWAEFEVQYPEPIGLYKMNPVYEPESPASMITPKASSSVALLISLVALATLQLLYKRITHSQRFLLWVARMTLRHGHIVGESDEGTTYNWLGFRVDDMVFICLLSAFDTTYDVDDLRDQIKRKQSMFSSDGDLMNQEEVAEWRQQQVAWEAMLDATRDDYIDCYKAMPMVQTPEDAALEAEYFAYKVPHTQIACLICGSSHCHFDHFQQRQVDLGRVSHLATIILEQSNDIYREARIKADKGVMTVREIIVALQAIKDYRYGNADQRRRALDLIAPDPG